MKITVVEWQEEDGYVMNYCEKDEGTDCEDGNNDTDR